MPLVSRATVTELTQVLAYSKFRLSVIKQLELVSDYLPCCQTIHPVEPCPVLCRDKKDQIFLDLAHCGKANILVTGDQDLLTLAAQTTFLIETPEAYRQRFSALG